MYSLVSLEAAPPAGTAPMALPLEPVMPLRTRSSLAKSSHAAQPEHSTRMRSENGARSASRLKLALLFVLALGVGSLTSCRATEEKRIFQYLNQEGFGVKARGDANVENYLVVGDSVTIRDSLNADLQLSPQEVDSDGTINLPDIGQVHVIGRTRRQLEAYLTEAYQPLYERTDIHVQFQSAAGASGRGKKYFVVGEVERQSAVAFTGDKSVFEAVLEAAPKSETANLGRVQLIRGDPVDPLIFTINFHDFIDYGDTTYNLIVRENDIIYVPPTFIGTVGHFVERIFYPVKVIIQPIQALLTFLLIQQRTNQQGGGIF